MNTTLRCGIVPALMSAFTMTILSAQTLPPTSHSGNPTPGTPQPDPPNLADRITVTGCVQAVNPSTLATPDQTTPSDSRFVLTDAKRENRVPPGTGTSAVAAAAASPKYRLHAVDSQLTAFVGMRVEISGEVESSTSNTASETKTDAPALRVAFIQKLAPTCAVAGKS